MILYNSYTLQSFLVTFTDTVFLFKHFLENEPLIVQEKELSVVEHDCKSVLQWFSVTVVSEVIIEGKHCRKNTGLLLSQRLFWLTVFVSLELQLHELP